MIYSIRFDSVTHKQTIICDVGDTRYFIPLDETNTDYQAYLEWVAAGNEPEVIEA